MQKPSIKISIEAGYNSDDIIRSIAEIHNKNKLDRNLLNVMNDKLKTVVDYTKLLGSKFGEAIIIDFFKFLEEIPKMERVEENLYYEYKNRGNQFAVQERYIKNNIFLRRKQ